MQNPVVGEVRVCAKWSVRKVAMQLTDQFGIIWKDSTWTLPDGSITNISSNVALNTPISEMPQVNITLALEPEQDNTPIIGGLDDSHWSCGSDEECEMHPDLWKDFRIANPDLVEELYPDLDFKCGGIVGTMSGACLKQPQPTIVVQGSASDVSPVVQKLLVFDVCRITN